jgi:hypothetical protein
MPASRIAIGAIAALSIGAIMVGILAAATPSVAASIRADDADKAKPVEKPTWDLLFSDWPEDPKPAFVVALTGEMTGYLRPCGCSEGQGGGLPRRAGVLKFLREELKLEVLPIDLGDLVGGTPAIEPMRYEAARKGLDALGYKVVAIGRQDLSITLLTLAQKLTDDVQGLKTIMGNVSAADKAMQEILAPNAKPFEIVDIAGLKVAVASLMDLDAKGGNADVVIEPLDKASTAMLKAIDEAKPAAKVLLAYMTKEKAIAFAQANPGWDLILTRSHGDDAHSQLDQHREGTTLVVSAGKKGKWIGAAGFWPQQKHKFRYAAIEVHARRFEAVDSVEKIYNGLVKDIHDSDVLSSMGKTSHVNGDEYVGAEACGKCHTKAYKKWSEEVAGGAHGPGHGHAFAFESLKKDRAKYQTSNPDCVSCHATGFKYRTGFVTAAKSPKLLGNQCENCHGPGKKHAENKDDLTFRKAMKLSYTEVEKSICRECHDLDNSPKFDFQKYWPKVAHPWRD